MDAIKAAVAAAVRNVLITGQEPDLDGVLGLKDVERITTHVVSDLETQVRVVTRTHGVRYFLVKVSEQL